MVSTFQVDGVSQSFTVAAYQGVMYASVVLTAGNPRYFGQLYSPRAESWDRFRPAQRPPAPPFRCRADRLTQTVPVAADGTYAVGPLPAGTYTVTPLSSNYTFSPTSQSVTLSTADVTNINFTAL